MNRTPAALAARSLALHRAVAARIRAEPALFDQARAVLERWLGMTPAHLRPALEEWRGLFDDGVDAALAMAAEESERGDRLRKSSPFCGVLSHQERWRLLRGDGL